MSPKNNERKILLNIRRKSSLAHILATILICVIGILSIIYIINIYLWSLGPSFGFTYLMFSGWDIVGSVSDAGYKAGFRLGDKILEVNGKSVDSLEKLRSNVERSIGSINRFTITRDGQIHTFSIETMYFGLINAFLTFGIPLIIGILIVSIGSFIFFTTPIEDKPWSFFFFCLCAGLVMIFFDHGSIKPSWIQIFKLVGYCFLPATIFHMCINFPLEVTDQGKKSLYRFFPYILSLFLLISIEALSPFLESCDKCLRISVIFYLLFSILVFVFILFYRYMKARFRLAKLKIRIVLLGFFIGVLLPLIEPILNSFNLYLIPNINLATLPFITTFPLFIGYAIAKHDLFEIDIFIKRTTGYILTTASIICIYFIFIFTANRFMGFIFHNQQIISIIFILAIVLFFNPIHNRARVIVDRVFYRKKYDYSEPVKQLLKEITFSFELNHIIDKLLQILTNLMFIDNVAIFLYSSEKNEYLPYDHQKNHIHNDNELAIPFEHPLVEHLVEEKKEVNREDFYESRQFASHREKLLNLFDRLNAQLILPFITHDKMSGFVSLGKIKSGREYNISDIEILRIIANYLAIAMENIHLFQDKIEKQKLEEELKIAGEIQKRMLPEVSPYTKYFYVYPRITPAIEIGGDFYDFFDIPSEEGKDLGIIVGDVSGHGIPGALLMSAAHTICQTQVLNLKDVGQVMEEANKLLVRETKKRSFVGLIYARLLSDKTITLANAGLPFPLYYDHSKDEVSFIETKEGRFPLGISDEPRYCPINLSIDKGDMILFYTDGVVEVKNKNNEFFSFDRLKDAFACSAKLEPEEIYTNLISELKDFSGNTHFEDDMTLVFLKHVDSSSFDTKLFLPVSYYNSEIISQCLESAAQLYLLNQDDISQLKASMDNIFNNIADHERIFLDYKMIISLFKYSLDYDRSLEKEHFKIIDPSCRITSGEILNGTKFIGKRFSLGLMRRDQKLERIDTGNITRIVIDFNH
ncbi:MAG: SpoIIE family protein phosphatase [bacterium]